MMVPIPRFACYYPVAARRVSPYQVETVGIAKPPNALNTDVYLLRTHYRDKEDPVHPSTHGQPHAVCIYRLRNEGNLRTKPKAAGYIHYFANHPPRVIWHTRPVEDLPPFLQTDARSALAHAKRAHRKLAPFKPTV